MHPEALPAALTLLDSHFAGEVGVTTPRQHEVLVTVRCRGLLHHVVLARDLLELESALVRHGLEALPPMLRVQSRAVWVRVTPRNITVLQPPA
jgi:hypothetical protein